MKLPVAPKPDDERTVDALERIADALAYDAAEEEYFPLDRIARALERIARALEVRAFGATAEDVTAAKLRMIAEERRRAEGGR